MKKAEKEQLVADLTSKLKDSKSLYYTDFTGLNVKRMTELRRRLKRAGVEYVVIKNTLALRAVNESGLVGEKLKGPKPSSRPGISPNLSSLETLFRHELTNRVLRRCIPRTFRPPPSGAG